ncbi:hypothetical protein WMF18_25575 [Sorangium sp. So ce315]|uniref:hypothetical protein n=1 Tax=Sorangium sp. So ce315 TaxID=3133299 RepID=UPI003F5E8F51
MACQLTRPGNETTTNLIGNGTLALLENPGARRRLREDPALIPGFIEEVLRFEGPARFLTWRPMFSLRGLESLRLRFDRAARAA